MKSPARFLYVVADAVGPKGVEAFCTVALAALLFGLLRIRHAARGFAGDRPARFAGAAGPPAARDEGT
jgi:hypothetical protein